VRLDLGFASEGLLTVDFPIRYFFLWRCHWWHRKELVALVHGLLTAIQWKGKAMSLFFGTGTVKASGNYFGNDTCLHDLSRAVGLCDWKLVDVSSESRRAGQR
jgi:hypothetical protein